MMTDISRYSPSGDFTGTILVNVVHVEDGKQEAALDVLRSTVQYVAERYEGFKWSRLYRSIDGKTVINQAAWTSADQFNTLFEDEGFKERYSLLQETRTWEFHLYEVTDLILPPTSAST